MYYKRVVGSECLLQAMPLQSPAPASIWQSSTGRWYINRAADNASRWLPKVASGSQWGLEFDTASGTWYVATADETVDNLWASWLVETSIRTEIN